MTSQIGREWKMNIPSDMLSKEQVTEGNEKNADAITKIDMNSFDLEETNPLWKKFSQGL